MIIGNNRNAKHTFALCRLLDQNLPCADHA
jgi:hypothetical protein